MNSRLTIVMPLFGRYLHTLRWLFHANKIKLRCKIIIADGRVNPSIARLLEDPRVFPDIAYEYKRYEDNSLQDCFRKLSLSLKKVKTPYVMVNDNDDFPLPSGIEQSIDFLDLNSDFICYGGRVAGVSLWPHKTKWLSDIIGKPKVIDLFYPARDMSSNDPLERISTLSDYIAIYYNIYRIHELDRIFSEVVTHDIEDVLIHEVFTYLRTLSLGKAYISPSIVSYIRQYGTSLGSGQSLDWFERLLNKQFIKDYEHMVTNIARAVSVKYQVDSEKADLVIRRSFSGLLRPRLKDILASKSGQKNARAFLRKLVPKQAEMFLRKMKNLEKGSTSSQIDKVINELGQNGATPEYLNILKKELFSVIQTLEDGSFLNFIDSHPEIDFSNL